MKNPIDTGTISATASISSYRLCHASSSLGPGEVFEGSPQRHITPAHNRHYVLSFTPIGAAHKCRYVRGGCGLRGVEIAGEVLESGVDGDGYDCVSGAKLARNVDCTDDVETGGCPRE